MDLEHYATFDEENPKDANTDTDVEECQPARMSLVKQHLWADVDPDLASLPLAAYCFMTGFIDAVTFTAISVWCGFQTGNTIELSLAVARLFTLPNSGGPSFRVIDRHSLASILSFLTGAFAGRIGDRIGARTRLWLFLGTLIQALCTMAAAILLWKGGQPVFTSHTTTWTNAEGYAAIAFVSASLGLQGIMGKRVNTQFATTIVLTTVWCELMADPQLFRPRLIKTRDLKVLAIASLLVGGFAGRSILDQLGAPATFGIGAGFRVVIALVWLAVPSKPCVKSIKG